jgi:hypothetical protein
MFCAHVVIKQARDNKRWSTKWLSAMQRVSQQASEEALRNQAATQLTSTGWSMKKVVDRSGSTPNVS